MSPLLRSALLIALTAVLAGCPPGRGRGDDDDAAGDDFGGLDRNSDGMLDADDVEPGSAASYISLNFEDAAESGDEALETTTVTLTPGSEAWSLQATFPSGTPDLTYSLSMRFQNLGTITPALGTGLVTNANMSPSDSAWYAYASDPGGSVEITAATETDASGFFTGPATLEVLGEFEEPTGETIVIHGFAFNGVPAITDAVGR